MIDIDRNRLIEIIKEIVNIPSEKPDGNEMEGGHHIFTFLKNLGFSPIKQIVDEHSFNILCLIKGTSEGRAIMYNGHIDVVPAGNRELWSHDPYDCVERDGKLYGRGTCDMKGSVGCILYVAERIANGEIDLAPDLLLTFTVDEENENKGIIQLIQSDINVDYCIIGEPTELDIAIGHRGVSTHYIELFGQNCHIANSDGHRNAIHDAAKVIEWIEGKNTELRRENSLIGYPQWKVTQVAGGIKSNVNPEYCKITADRRFIFGETKDSLINDLELLKRTFPEMTIQYGLVSYVAPALEKESCRAVHDVQGAILATEGKRHAVKELEAGCEQSFIQHNGIECIVFGPGSLKQAHVIDEFVSITQLIDYVQIISALMGNPS